MTVFTIKVFGLKKPAVVSSVVKINAEKLRSPSIEKRKDEGGRGIVPVKKEKKSFIDIFGLLCRTCYYCKLQFFFIISYSVDLFRRDSPSTYYFIRPILQLAER